MKKYRIIILKISFLILVILAVFGYTAYISRQPANAQFTNTITNNTTQPTKIDIKNFVYVPTIVFVTNGTNVTWINDDVVPHTVTSVTGIFDSGTINQGLTYSHIFNQTGSYEYGCTIHQSVPHGIVAVINQ
jgi:plastocyanin